VAPFAVKGTPLQENGRANPGPVINGKPLYVKYQSLHFFCRKKAGEEKQPAIENGVTVMQSTLKDIENQS
jgi:hypothetical protein